MNFNQIYNREITLQPQELSIVVWPDERLHVPCEKITSFDDGHNKHLQQLTLDMLHTMHLHNGIGLAAPQVGIPARLFVSAIDVCNTFQTFINPTIIEQSNNMFLWKEGCISVPGYFENRKRPNRIVVQFQDLIGKKHEMELLGLWAFVAQHEIEHLNGKVFIDDLSPFKKSRVSTKIKKTLNLR